MLLEEIIELASSADGSVVVLLRKCLVLGHRLKNERLVRWANQELQGYDENSNLPEYRRVQAGALGILSGPFGAKVSNYPIPPALLQEKHRMLAAELFLSEPIANYEELMKSDSKSFTKTWPANLVLFYQNKIRTQNGCHLAYAWQEIGRSAFAQIFDAVKNRTLGLALELQDSIGSESLEAARTKKAQEIMRSVTNNIYGGVNVIASGQSHVQNSYSDVNNGTSGISREHLTGLLEQGGLSPDQIAQLSEAIEADKPERLGTRTKRWVESTGSKLLVGGIKVTSTVAQGGWPTHISPPEAPTQWVLHPYAASSRLGGVATLSGGWPTSQSTTTAGAPHLGRVAHPQPTSRTTYTTGAPFMSSPIAHGWGPQRST